MADAIDRHSPATFRLVDLPNEIIREICIRPELETNDLRALRLTSKQLCEIASHRFAKERFRRVTVLMSRFSLRAFIDLSQHAYFGSFVERVNISPVCDGIPSRPPPTTSVSGNIYRDRVMDVVMSCVTRFRKEREPMNDGSAGRMLGIAFKAFAQREQPLQLKICDREFHTIGARDLVYSKAFQQNLVWRLDWQTTIEQTIRAITSQGCKVTALLIDGQTRANLVNDSVLHTDNIEQQLSCLCSNLAHLEIEFHDFDIGTTSDSVERMVSTARNLKSLILKRLGMWDYSNRHCVPKILECVASTSLSTIVLAEFQMSESELLGFLGRQRDALRNLQLHDSCLLTGSCMSLIAWIRDNLPGLVQLELWDICDSADHTICAGDEPKRYCVRRGHDMQVCLTRILDGKGEKQVKPKDVEEIE
ncbi:hypothetical protein E4T52_12055 [Aureobasidium sp. EXF-3400]|nr:hypothetical protein E4T51_11056 [Aureobasidium sp. EXF-12344]KAI4772954.1 hypothetical protein E4T52_12055 [Aureobasidium sp. EXF-3400]